MTRTNAMRHLLLVGLFLLAAGSLSIHLKIHSPFYIHGPGEIYFTNSVASLLSFIDLFGVTFLFSRKKTAAWGYLLNGLIVIYGTVMMAHWGWTQFHPPGSPVTLLLSAPTSIGIGMAWGDFTLGAILYRLWFVRPKEAPVMTPEAPA